MIALAETADVSIKRICALPAICILAIGLLLGSAAAVAVADGPQSAPSEIEQTQCSVMVGNKVAGVMTLTAGIIHAMLVLLSH